MKRKKLRLHRDTLYGLTQSHLGRVAGGGETHEINTGCACTDTCDTCAGCGGSAGCSNPCTGTGTGGDYTCTCFNPPSYCYC